MVAGPSLKSVATAAGVSVSSVSNAYNRPEQLSAAVRERILTVAREQGYAGPDAAARSLRSRRAGAIGVLYTAQLSYAFSDPYSVGLLAGVAQMAERSRTGLLLLPLAAADSGDVDASVAVARQAVVDGVITYCVDPDHPARQVIERRGLPVVSSTDDGSENTKRVLIDEVGAARRIGRLIRKLGHRRIGIVLDSTRPAGRTSAITDDDDPSLYAGERLRLRGFRQGLGRDCEITAVSGGHNAIDSGRAAAEELLDRADRPTAILAISDVLALGVLQAMAERDLVAGRDVSVTGFDDIPGAEAAGLTTMHQPISERGRLLARMLLDPSYAENRVVLPTRLVVRASTGPVPYR
jgi:DNA-binding LacI/PurR family transcriptional regulator